jgi:hypothetical protein
VAEDRDVALELLRAQLLSCRTQMTLQTRERLHTTELLQRYLERLFPHLFPQALAARMNVPEAAEYFYDHHLDRVGHFGVGPEEQPKAETDPAREESSVNAGVELSGDGVHFLYAAGLSVLSTDIKALWARHTGKAVGTARNTVVPELLDRGLLRVERLSVPGYLTGYATDTCYVLTERGREEYRRRFSSEPITFEGAYAAHKSPEAWWMVRATKALIEAGTAHPANQRFAYQAYDPSGDPDAATEAGIQRRYGHSEPDLVVVVASKTAGKPGTLAVECERGSYTATRLKQKVIKNLRDYGEAGFSGCYYVASNNEVARKLAGALVKVRADLKERPETLPVRGFLALFTLDALKACWLPTPRFIDEHLFDRKTRRVSSDWPVDAAKPERYFRHSAPSATSPSGVRDGR